MRSKKIAAVLVTVTVTLLSVSGSKAAGVVFRYLPGASEVSSDVESQNVEEPGPFLDLRERVARGPGGWGYEPAWAAEFEAPESVMWEASSDDVNQPLGPKLTAEVWMRLLEIDQSHTLLTNRVGSSDGLTVGLDGGVPFFELVVDGNAYRVEAMDAVAEDTDFWLAATAEYSGSSGLELTLYRDGRLAAQSTFSTSIPTPYGIRHPFYVGTHAEGSDASPTLAGSITGLLYAAVVRDYVAAEDYVNTPPPFDGSAYFGMPDFHDYEVGGFQLPMDQRIDSYATPIKQKVYLPHVNDEFIPQGTAVTSSEDTGEAELIYVAYYHRTRDNRLRMQPSIVAEIVAATGAVRRTFRLTGRLDDSHAGGIAIAGGAIYVSSEGYLERYPIPPFDPDEPRYLDLTVDDAGSAAVLSKSSFVSEYADTLWVGDYRTASQQAPYLYGYPLDSSGRLISSADPTIYPIPRRIQGVDFYADGGTTFVFMTRNRNSTEGEALRFRRSDLNPHSVPMWEASITLPHGIEDLSFTDDGTMWSNSESGTEFYQRNVQWSSFFPYAFGVERFGVIPTATEHEPRPRGDLRFDAYPNPASDHVDIRFVLDQARQVRVRIVDSLGRYVATLLDRPLSPGTHAVTWDADRVAAGAYLIAFDDGTRRRFQSIILVR